MKTTIGEGDFVMIRGLEDNTVDLLEHNANTHGFGSQFICGNPLIMYIFNGQVRKADTRLHLNGVEFTVGEWIDAKPLQPVFSQDMQDNNELPPVGSKFLVGDNLCVGSRILDFKGLEVTVIGLSVSDNGNDIITFSNPITGVGCGVNMSWVKPIDTRTDKEKAIDYMKYAYEKGNSMEDVLSEITKGYIAGVKWAGES